MVGEHAFKHETTLQLVVECNFHLEMTPAQVSMRSTVSEPCKQATEEGIVAKGPNAHPKTYHSVSPVNIL